MSGDRVLKTPWRTSKITSEVMKESDVLKGTDTPITITVTSNGNEIRSKLNPNASEFFPTYLQNNFATDVLDEQHFVKDLEDQSKSTVVQNFLKGEEIENVSNKSETSIEKNQLNVIYVSTSTLKYSSSESILIAKDNEISSLEKQKEKETKHRYCRNIDDVSSQLNLEEINSEKSVKGNVQHLKAHLSFDIFNENNNTSTESKQKIDESSHNRATNSLEKDEHVKEAQVASLEMQNIKRSNETNNTTVSQKQQVSKEVIETKKKRNVNSQITRVPKPTTGTIKKFQKTKTEYEKEIKDKTESAIAQKSNLNKSCKTTISIPNKTCSNPIKKEMIKVSNKTTAPNKSINCTDKTASSNKSSVTNNSAKSFGQSVALEKKTKQCILKCPRPTISSKLRKAEKQKVN